jgi:hypothetical protein
MLKNKCCLYFISSIRFFSITICNLLIELPSYQFLLAESISASTATLLSKRNDISNEMRLNFICAQFQKNVGFLNCVYLHNW